MCLSLGCLKSYASAELFLYVFFEVETPMQERLGLIPRQLVIDFAVRVFPSLSLPVTYAQILEVWPYFDLCGLFFCLRQ